MKILQLTEEILARTYACGNVRRTAFELLCEAIAPRALLKCYALPVAPLRSEPNAQYGILMCILEDVARTDSFDKLYVALRDSNQSHAYELVQEICAGETTLYPDRIARNAIHRFGFVRLVRSLDKLYDFDLLSRMYNIIPTHQISNNYTESFVSALCYASCDGFNRFIEFLRSDGMIAVADALDIARGPGERFELC